VLQKVVKNNQATKELQHLEKLWENFNKKTIRLV